MNCYTQKFDINIQKKLKDFFEKDGAVISDLQNAIFRAKKSEYAATFYNTGKLLIQGSEISEIVKKLENFLGIIQNITENTKSTQSDTINVPISHIGVDESGKGDFFGPLVIAGVLVDETNTELLVKAGIKDCKKIEDKNINKLAAVIKNNCIFSVVTINPAKYNELYEKLKNLNCLLAWGHARVIENILEKKECNYALSDKFGDENLIKNALLKKGKKITLEQRCKAESDIAVAAASILARAQFLYGLSEISKKYGVDIPKGVSEKVINTARTIKDKYSKDELKNAVKAHFKTFEKI